MTEGVSRLFTRSLAESGILRQFIRFLMGGIANTTIAYGMYLALLPFFGYLVAYISAVTLGVIFLTIVNTKFVFNKDIRRKTVTLFSIYQFFYTLTFATFLVFTVEVMRINPIFAPLVVLTIITPANFLMTRCIFHGTGR